VRVYIGGSVPRSFFSLCRKKKREKEREKEVRVLIPTNT
jgi:hypothetical protein